MNSPLTSDPALAAAITRAASGQTYYTIRFLVDRGLVQDAYRIYAYFRWVDDWLDQEARPLPERLAFVQRQQALIAGEDGAARGHLAPEERLVTDLLGRHGRQESGLMTYFNNMMAVMAFDARRRGQLITQGELNDYTYWLASAVTEALHYFIGHDCASPQGPARYQAVSGAHITHMLRDTLDDIAAGYYNIPRQVVEAAGISPADVEHPAYRDWVRGRVDEARRCFRAGREYLGRVEALRCRIAGYAYMHRFELVLDSIERDGFWLRAQYPERKGSRGVLAMVGWALRMGLINQHAHPGPRSRGQNRRLKPQQQDHQARPSAG